MEISVEIDGDGIHEEVGKQFESYRNSGVTKTKLTEKGPDTEWRVVEVKKIYKNKSDIETKISKSKSPETKLGNENFEIGLTQAEKNYVEEENLPESYVYGSHAFKIIQVKSLNTEWESGNFEITQVENYDNELEGRREEEKSLIITQEQNFEIIQAKNYNTELEHRIEEKSLIITKEQSHNTETLFQEQNFNTEHCGVEVIENYEALYSKLNTNNSVASGFKNVFNLLCKFKRGEPILSPDHRQVFVGVVVACVGCILGLVLAYPNLALDEWMLNGDVTLSPKQAQWFGSVVYLSSIPGSCIGGMVMQNVGPRRMLLVLLPALALVWLPLTLATQHPNALLILRTIQGVLASSCGLSVYVYPCEVVEARRRGLIGSLPDTSFSLGFLMAHLLASLFHWSTVFLIIPICFIFPAVLIISTVPESPVWLINKGKLREARQVLRNIRPDECNVEKEVLSIQLSRSDFEPINLKSLLKQMHIFLPILVAMVLVVLKESTGQIMVALTAVRIFREVDMGLSPLWTSVLVSCARFGANLVALVFLKYFPRRHIISISSFIAGIAMLTLASYFYATDIDNSWPEWVPFVSLLIFVVAYGVGVGPPVSLLITELLPGAVRGFGSGISNALLCSFQFGLTYMASREDFRFNVCFWGFAVGCLILAAFTLLLPETQNTKLEDLEQFWREPKLKPSYFKYLSGVSDKSIFSSPDALITQGVATENTLRRSVTHQFSSLLSLSTKNKMIEEHIADNKDNNNDTQIFNMNV